MADNLLTFKCDLTGNVLEFYLDRIEKIAYFNIKECDPTKPKPLFQLLRTSIDDIKSKGFLKIRQDVIMEDWKYFESKKTSWKSVFESKYGTMMIETCIDDAIENIALGLGINYTLKI